MTPIPIRLACALLAIITLMLASCGSATEKTAATSAQQVDVGAVHSQIDQLVEQVTDPAEVNILTPFMALAIHDGLADVTTDPPPVSDSLAAGDRLLEELTDTQADQLAEALAGIDEYSDICDLAAQYTTLTSSEPANTPEHMMRCAENLGWLTHDSMTITLTETDDPGIAEFDMTTNELLEMTRGMLSFGFVACEHHLCLFNQDDQLEPEPEQDWDTPDISTPAAPEPGSEPDDPLTKLAVQPEASRDGYDRDLFNHWIDANSDGCDTRREVLIDEATRAPEVSWSCELSNGAWVSAYDGSTETGAGSGFDIDHLVPLAEAWDSGAWAWNDQQRQEFANDTGHPDALIAVSASANRSKSDRDPAEWLPPQTKNHCWYAHAWVDIKLRWELSVDQAEHDALRELFDACDGYDYNDNIVPWLTIDAPERSSADTADNSDEMLVTACHPSYEPSLPWRSGDATNCADLMGTTYLSSH